MRLCCRWDSQTCRRRTDVERGRGRLFARTAFQVPLQSTTSDRETVLDLEILSDFLVARAQILEGSNLVCEPSKFPSVSLLSLSGQKLV